MLKNQLPQEILGYIFTFDNTYRRIYSEIIFPFQKRSIDICKCTDVCSISIRFLIDENLRIVTASCPQCLTTVTTCNTTTVTHAHELC